jgi:hypothetical protein
MAVVRFQRIGVPVLLAAVVAMVSAGCGSGTARSAAPGRAPARPASGQPTPPPAPPADAHFWAPAPGAPWQWQLTVPVDQRVDVPVYDIDVFDNPKSVVDSLHAQGRKVICYMDAGAWESYRPDAGSFPRSVIGNGTGWDNERWLDIRQIGIIGPIIAARMDLAVSKGCDAIEPDQDNGWENNPGFQITREDSIRWNIWVAETAHSKGLSVGLKNSTGETAELEPYFDWDLNEQCFQFGECQKLVPFLHAGKPVLQVEYQGDPAQFCAKADTLGFSSMKKHLDLDAWRIPCP